MISIREAYEKYQEDLKHF